MTTAVVAASGPRMTVGGVLSRSFAVLGAAPLVFFGTSLLLTALPSLATRFLLPSLTQPFAAAPRLDTLAQVWPTLLGYGLVWLLLYEAAKIVLIRAAAAGGEGRPEPIGGYLAAVPGALLPLLGLTILLGLAVWIGFLFLVVPGIVLALMWAVATPALIVERPGIFAAFGRSRRLTKGARWQILGLFLLVFAIYFAATMLLGIGNVAFRNGQVIPANASPSVLSTLLSLALQTVFVAVLSAVEGVLFVDLRNWKDGPGTTRLAEIFS